MTTTDPTARDPREDLLDALDFAFVVGPLGYGSREELLAAYDASRVPVSPPADPTGLRDRIAEAIREATCPGNCGKTEEQCARERIQPFAWHHGRLAVVEGEPEMFADAVLAVLPPTDRAADEPIRCPLCADVSPLHTPAEAREHFAAAHPEQVLWGPGPWPMLGTPPERADRAALRDRIADLLAAADGWRWSAGFNKTWSPAYRGYQYRADAVLAVLPPTADRAAVLLWAADFAEEVAEKLRAHHEFERSNGALDVMTELRRVAAEKPTNTETEARSYDERINAPLSDEACAALRERLDSDSAARRTVRIARPVVGEQPDTQKPDRIVAYSPGGRTLRCLDCRPNPLGSDWRALTAEELEDGGICTVCGVDVLIPLEAQS